MSIFFRHSPVISSFNFCAFNLTVDFLWKYYFSGDIGLDDKLGKCKIKLDDLGLSAQPTGLERVVDNNLIRKDGKVYLQISYKE